MVHKLSDLHRDDVGFLYRVTPDLPDNIFDHEYHGGRYVCARTPSSISEC